MKCEKCSLSYCIEPYNHLMICNSNKIEKQHRGEVIWNNCIPFWCPYREPKQ